MDKSSSENMIQKDTVDTTNVASLKEKYGKIYMLNLTLNPDDDTEIELSYIFQKPTTASYDRYVKSAANSMSKSLKTFMFDNVIPEHKEKLEKDMDDYPALALSAGEKLLSMLGLSKTANLMKL